MSQATVPASFSRSSETPDSSATSVSSLHPQVKLALGYLDSSLEDELMRYRKARSGKRVAPSSVRVMQGSQRLASKADVELTRFVPIDQMPKSPQPSHSTINPPSALTSEPNDGQKLNGQKLNGQKMLATEFLDQLAMIPEDGTENGSGIDDRSALDVSYSLSDLLDNPSIEQLSREHLSREHLSRSIDHSDIQGAEDYLESSEELLRSLAQEEADADSERNGLENLMTPFGIGSMLLLLMASGMFGYLVMNPATFASIGSTLSRLFKSPLPIATSIETAETANPSLTTSGVIPTRSEFMDLSLNNLAVMGTQNNPSGLPSLSGLVPGKSSNSSTTRILGGKAMTGKPGESIKTVSRTAAPSAIGGAAPAAAPGGGLFQGGNSSLGTGGIFKDPAPQAEETPPVYTPPAYTPPTYTSPRRSSAPRSQEPAYRAPIQSPQQPLRTVPMELPPSTPTSIPPVPVESAAPMTPTYRVEAPYTGDRALEKAQQADPSAYFRNGENGAVVQMGGSYSSREEAEAKAESLKKQGFDGVEVVK